MVGCSFSENSLGTTGCWQAQYKNNGELIMKWPIVLAGTVEYNGDECWGLSAYAACMPSTNSKMKIWILKE